MANKQDVCFSLLPSIRSCLCLSLCVNVIVVNIEDEECKGKARLQDSIQDAIECSTQAVQVATA